MNNNTINLYIDESGNTGEIKNKDFNYNNERKDCYFSNGLIWIKNDSEKQELIEKYNDFKIKYNNGKIVKGNELTTKKFNDALKHLIENVFNNNFIIISRDKKYFIAFEIVHFLLENNKKDYLYKNYLAEFLSTQESDIFVEFLKLSDEPNNKDNLINFLNFLLSYDYIGYWDDLRPCFFKYLKLLKKKPDLEYGVESLQYIPNADNISVALTHYLKNFVIPDKFIIIHDEQKQFEQNIISTITTQLTEKQIQYEIKFESDDNNEMLQLTDNFVGVFNNIVKKILSLNIDNKDEYESIQTKWLFSTFSLLINKITLNNTNFLLPLSKKTLLYTIVIHWKDNLSFDDFNKFYDLEIEKECRRLNGEKW